MNFNLVTIFPEIAKLLDFGVIGKAIEKDLISINGLNPRDFSKSTNKNVDDAPYGGGEGMVMMAEPLALAIKSLKKETLRNIIDLEKFMLPKLAKSFKLF